jgi:molecular chaperone DnaK/molecular chaperone HscA
LKASVMGGDYKVIRAAIERLDQATRRFAELMMDSAVTGALGGKTMQAAGESIGEGPSAPHPFAKAQVLSAEKETKEIEDSVKQQATAGESTED